MDNTEKKKHPLAKHYSNGVVPDCIKAFYDHGLIIQDSAGREFICMSPWTGKDKKFYLNKETGQWSDKITGDSGNLHTFLDMHYKGVLGMTTKAHRIALGKDRELPSIAFKKYGVAFDGDHYLLPVRNSKGTMTDLRKYRLGQRLISTAGCKLNILGIEKMSDPKNAGLPVYLCEGEWDSIALDYLIQDAEQSALVVGNPGAGTFKPEWVESFRGRNVVCCYDADDAGDKGALKVYAMLTGVARSLEFINWPEDVPDGWDIRDFVKTFYVDKSESPLEAFNRLRALVSKKPRRAQAKEGAVGATASTSSGLSESAPMPTGPRPTFKQIVKAFTETGMVLKPEMIDAFRLMCAVILTNYIEGDPVWLFVVGPPGSGKTTLLNALVDVPQCVFRSSVTPHALVSGFNNTPGGVDPSLIPQLDGKVFVLKDYTEVLALNKEDQESVYAILRGAFDGRVERSWGNGVTRIFDCHFSLIAGVTNAIHSHSRAAMGERFLKYQYQKETVYDAGEQIASAIAGIGKESHRGDKLRPMLRHFLTRTMDEFTGKDWVTVMFDKKYQARLVALSQIVAMLRAQVDRNEYRDTITARPQHETGTRLAKQLTKLGLGICLVDGKERVDDSVYRLMEQVAFDTATGFHLDIVACIMKLGGKVTKKQMEEATKLPSTNIYRILEDLVMLGVVSKVEAVKEEDNPHALGNTKVAYSATKRIRLLWKQAEVGEHDIVEPLVRRKRKVKVKTKG